MKVKLLRSIIAAKKPRKLGDIVLVSEKEGEFLISRNLAEEYKGKNKAVNEEEPKK